jgi:hypothetical protein
MFISEVDRVDRFLLDKLAEYERDFDRMASNTLKKLVDFGFEEDKTDKKLSVIGEADEIFE